MPTLMNWLRRWYQGKYIPPEPLDDDDCQGVVVVNVGHHQRHWSARLVAAVVDFCRLRPVDSIVIALMVVGIWQAF